MESKIAHDFRENSASFFKDRVEYEHVHVLLIYWREGDLEVSDELDALRHLFGTGLNYLVASFPIPGDGTQQARLNNEVANFVAKTALQQRSLSIIYYAGHCTNAEGKAKWAARSRGGPTLIWSDIQQSLFYAHGDVLLVLDCCHATLISTGHKQAGRFEVLAACAKGLETPVPGKQSFTRAILDTLTSDVLKLGISAQKLRSVIDGKTRETPFWDSIGSDAVTSIVIKRLSPPSNPRFMSKPNGYVIIRASLLDDLDGIQLSNWLKTNAPANVTAVNIEAIVLKARRLQRNLDNNAFPSNSVLRRLPEPAQTEIIQQLQMLDTRMTMSMQQAQSSLGRQGSNSTSEALKSIESTANAVTTSIETSILLDLDHKQIDLAMSDEHALSVDALEAISLRQRILGAEGNHIASYLISSDDLRFPLDSRRFCYAPFQDRIVLLEFFDYEPDVDGEPFVASTEQLKQMTAMLCHPKRLSFLILPCLGYVHDEINYKFGLVFQKPLSASEPLPEPVTLRNVYKAKTRMPLGHRIRLALDLIQALESFHRVGWVHKGMNSDNICFLPRSGGSEVNGVGQDGIDISKPYIFGFEYARAAAAGTKMEEDHSEFRNLYRHPQRWSRPTSEYTRAHDIYSMGIVLMEIAFWREITKIGSIKAGRGRVNPNKFRDTLMQKLDEDLPHLAGEVFTDTIHACFEFDEHSADMTEFEAQKLFQKNILGRITHAVGRV